MDCDKHRFSIAVFLLLATLPFSAGGATLRAGAAKSIITPDVKAGKVYMADFDSDRVATGVHDDLYVRCLALNAGKEIATVPGEIYPELVNGGVTRYPGADFPGAPFEPIGRTHMKSKFQFVFGLANDELGYIIPKAEWDNEAPWLGVKSTRWYGEVNSCGRETAGSVTRALAGLMDGK